MASITIPDSSLHSQTSLSSSSIFYSSSTNAERLVDKISEILEKESKVVGLGTRVSIFSVPKALRAFRPEAYAPQLMGLGPYHHIREELFEMERYKLAAANRLMKHFHGLEFKELVDQLKEFEDQIRASYHKYLKIEGDDLLWIMTLDGLFLLEFLDTYVNKKDGLYSSSRTALLLDSGGNKLAHHAILSDIMMLENQIPCILLEKILSIKCSTTDIKLHSMLLEFCKIVSPLKFKEKRSSSEVSNSNCAHLLDLLYHLTVPQMERSSQPCGRADHEGCTTTTTTTTEGQRIPESKSGNIQIFCRLWDVISKINIGWVRKITNPIKALKGLPWDVVKDQTGFLGLNDEENIPLVDEIMIPSVSDLCGAGVEFCPSTGDISTIKFDKCKKKFYLPVIKLNVNSEIIIRNLVAYEASILPESLVFTRYTELMNGIIDTAEDAKLLRTNKIIMNSTRKKDDEVAQLFNGMSKSIQLSHVEYIDKAIQDVNKYFDNKPRVRMYKCMKKYVYDSWQILTVLATILFMLLMAIQSFCSVYRCPRLFNTINSEG